MAAVVTRGEAEIGFQQVSEMLHVSGISYVGSIPSVLQLETSYSAAIAAGAKQSDAASALIRFLVQLRSQAMAILRR